MYSSKLQRTYSSRNHKNLKTSAVPPSSPPSTLSSSPPATPGPSRPSKRPLCEITTPLSKDNIAPLFPPLKRFKALPKPSSSTAKSKASSKSRTNSSKLAKQKTLTQLHFNIDQTILRTCSLCDLSYTKGAPDDEALHRAHCSRVRQGMEWGREEEKDRIRNGENVVIEVATDIKLKGGKKKGRIICFPADVGGKLGAKLGTLLQTINLALSSPPLLSSVLQCSKAYLFLLPHETQTHRELIAGCVIAQRIATAMAVIPSPSRDPSSLTPDHLDLNQSLSLSTPKEAATLGPVIVDTTTNLFCWPTPLPTPMGIPRLFVSSSHRRLGIAQALLDAAAATFIYGCPLDPRSGQVAFSQPTGMGQAVMKSWGKGGVRVFEE